MKKLTQILSLNFGANFLSEENKDGKIIDVTENQIVKFVPLNNILRVSKAVKGVFIENPNRMQLFLPLVFENNTVDSSILNNYPDELNFYIRAIDAEKFAYCGLDINGGESQLLYLTPKNSSKDYLLLNRTISAKPCSKGNVVAKDDLVVGLPADVTRDYLINIIGDNILNVEILKFEIGGNTVVFSLKNDLSELHNLLNSFVNKKTSVKIRNNADDSLIKEFPNVFVTQSELPSDIIGIVSIPKTAIISSETDYEKYDGLNHFVTHFPITKTKLEIEISVNSFENSDKLFLDTKSIPYTISNHPSMVDWKMVSCSVDNYFIYLNKKKNILLKTGNKVYELPVNPILTYDSKSNKSKINITKNIN